MSDALVCCEAWFQDASPVCCDARASSTSLLSYMDDHWSQPFCGTELLECSEDADTYEDYELRGDASSVLDNSTKQSPLATPYHHRRSELIRSDLQNQNEIFNELHSSHCSSGRGLSAWLPPTTQADRQLLVSWMLQLSAAAGLQRETLFGAASLLDRFLDASYRNQQSAIPSERMLQLLAMACISVAMKMEECLSRAPIEDTLGPAVRAKQGLHLHPSTLLRVASDPRPGRPLYQIPDLGRMEWVLLQTVGWRAHAPTPHTFMQHLLGALMPAKAKASHEPWAAASPTPATPPPNSLCTTPVGTPLMGSPSEASSSCCGADCNGDEADGACIWTEDLEPRASALLDLALVCTTPLAHRPSTLAMACLLMAASYTTGQTPDQNPSAVRRLGGAVTDTQTSSSVSNTSAAPAASPFLTGGAVAAAASAERFRLLLRTVVDVTGLSVEQLAPGLTACVGELEEIMVRQQQAAAAAMMAQM